MTATTEPAVPGAVASPPATPVTVAATPASVTLTEASFLQLLKQAGIDAKADVVAAPSKLGTAVKAVPGELEALAKKVNWPMVIVAVVAFAALAMHFPKLTGLL